MAVITSREAASTKQKQLVAKQSADAEQLSQDLVTQRELLECEYTKRRQDMEAQHQARHNIKRQPLLS